MTKKKRLQQIKLLIKASIIIGVLFVFIVLGLFVRPNRTFENANMKKWVSLDDAQRIETINRIVKDNPNQDLLIQCVNKIASLENSNEMAIKDAIVICDAGIKANLEIDDKEQK